MKSPQAKNALELQLKRTAYHEAGHAMMAFLMGVPLVEISNIPDPVQGSMGHTKNRWNPTEDDSILAPLPTCGRCAEPANAAAVAYTVNKKSERRDMRDVALINLRILFAGNEAVSLWSKRRDPQGAADDTEKAVEIAETRFAHQSPKTRDAFLRAIRLDTRDELHAYWNYVEVLAETLFVQRTISARRVLGILVACDKAQLRLMRASLLPPARAFATKMFRRRAQRFGEILGE